MKLWIQVKKIPVAISLKTPVDNGLVFIIEKSLFDKDQKAAETRFFKSIINLSIFIKPTTITIKANKDKELINNVYKPIHINTVTNPYYFITNSLDSLFNYLNNKLNLLLKKTNFK